MSVLDRTPQGNWRPVTPAHPCPICAKPDWCRVSADGKVAVCRRVENGARKSKTDKQGTPYYLHRLPETPRAEHTPPPMPRGPEVRRAGPDTLHEVYSGLLAALALSSAHHKNLKARGLSDGEIDRRYYRSLPIKGRADIASKLREHLGDNVLSVPGFITKTKKGGDYLTFAGAAGLLVPVRDADGRIVALKVRRDTGSDGHRYCYLSSAQYGGASPGSPIHIPLGIPSPAEIVRLTEGELKADIAFALSGLPTISVPGAGNWQPALEVLKALGCKRVVLAFDMDAQEKPHVAGALLACAKTLITEGFAVSVERWPVADGKGIDDLLAASKTPDVLPDDAALEAVHAIARAAGVDSEKSEATIAVAAEALEQLPYLLKAEGAVGLFRNRPLLEALAEISVEDPPRYAEMRVLLRPADVRMRDFERAIRRIVTEKIKVQPPDLARSETGGFFENDGCICRSKLTPDGPLTIQLSNFTATIKDETIRDDGVERKVVLGVNGKLAAGGELPRIEVPAEVFVEMKWVVPMWGADAIVWPGETRAVAPAIQALSGDKTRQTVYTHTGWRTVSDGLGAYLHAGGAIGSAGVVNDVRVELPQPLAGFELPAPPNGSDLSATVRASLEILKLTPHHISFPLLAGGYRAALGESDFSLHLAGPTGVFKSELAALAQQHFGAGLDARHLPANWASTGNSLEGLAFLAKDTLLVLDDFAPTGSQSDVQRLNREADRIIRAQGNHAGRQRMNRDGTLRPGKPPRGLILSTGEDVPSGQSLRSRLFTIEVSPGDVDKEQLTACQTAAASGTYARAMAGYVQWLAGQYGTIRGRLRNEVTDLREKAIAGSPHARTPEIVANLAVGLRYLLAFAVNCRAIRKDQAEQLWDRGWIALADAAAAQASHHVDAEPTGRFLRLLTAALASGRAHVASTDGHEPDDAPTAWGWTLRTISAGPLERPEWQAHGRRIGWVDGADLYLEPEASFAEAQRFVSEQGESLPVSAPTLRRRLKEKGLLMSTDDVRQRLIVRRHLEGARREVLHLAACYLVPVVGTGTVVPANSAVALGPSHQQPQESQGKSIVGTVGTVGTVTPGAA